MEITALGIAGAWACSPTVHRDARGTFHEWFRQDELAVAVGHPLPWAQGNLSTSVRGTVRGIHFADVPPGQAKYVQCIVGAVLDFVIDIRVGSPTFGRAESVELSEENRTALYLAEGLGHCFVALTDTATVSYLVSAPYNPSREHAVSPLDPTIGLAYPFPADALILTEKDRAAPTLAAARDQGILPTWDACLRQHPASAPAPAG